ncbi:MAG: energy-coupled thiamine transporter ThiT [Clostridiales bacterium]|mgnify:FL=1|jgi:thiamine transporter|nr:energy-coupled thiamine transporter ThiT [Clostridiales bacterium]
MKKSYSKIRVLTESAILIAMASLLSMIKLWSMPLGGSVTPVSMLPILLIGYRHGPVWGLISGLGYSILQFIERPYFLLPLQFLLDYTLPFTALGLVSFFRNRKYGFQIGSFISIGVRTICHVLSGVLFFGEYAAEAGFDSAVAYTFAYNLSYMIPELILTLAVGTVVIAMLKKANL